MEPMNNERAANAGVSRRTFLTSTGRAACASVAGAALVRSGCRATFSTDAGTRPAILHAAAHSPEHGSAIHSFLLDGERCTQLAATPCTGIAAMAMHPSLAMLYVAADAPPGQALPHGHVEAFKVDGGSGAVRLVARVAMSLSATGPRGAAVSPDGAFLIVTAYAGGILNAYPLDRNGMPAAVPVARKELGAGGEMPPRFAAHPHSLACIPGTRCAIVTDTGSNQLSIISPGSEQISALNRWAAPAGSGPGHAALSYDGQHLYVAGSHDSSLSLWSVDTAGSVPTLEHLSTMRLPTRVTAMVTHPSSDIAFSIRPAGGGSRLDSRRRARLISTALLPYCSASSLAFHGDCVWAATSQGLLRISLDREGRLQRAALQARLPGAAALAMQPLGVS